MDVTRDFQIVTAGAEKPDTEQRVIIIHSR